MNKEQTAILTAFYSTLPLRVRSHILDVLGSRIENDEEWAETEGEEDFLTSPQHVTICAMRDALIEGLDLEPVGPEASTLGSEGEDA